MLAFVCISVFLPNFPCEVRVLTNSVERTLGMNSSAAGHPFRVRFWRQFWQVPIYRSAEFRGKLWRSDFWWRERLQSGTLWRPRNAGFTVSILTWFRSGIVQLSCAVVFFGCMETYEEGFFCRPLFDAVQCRFYKLLFYSVVTHSGLSTCWELTRKD